LVFLVSAALLLLIACDAATAPNTRTTMTIRRQDAMRLNTAQTIFPFVGAILKKRSR
jgi:hypothetical protein